MEKLKNLLEKDSDEEEEKRSEKLLPSTSEKNQFRRPDFAPKVLGGASVGPLEEGQRVVKARPVAEKLAKKLPSDYRSRDFITSSASNRAQTSGSVLEAADSFREGTRIFEIF